MTSPATELRRLVSELNAAWVEGRPDDLGAYFHDDMVIVTPDFTHRLHGREPCVESYRDFLRQAVVHAFRADEAEVDVAGSTAVVAYRYEIEYEHGGARHHEHGRDLFVFAREAERWQAVWRLLLPGGAGGAGGDAAASLDPSAGDGAGAAGGAG